MDNSFTMYKKAYIVRKAPEAIENYSVVSKYPDIFELHDNSSGVWIRASKKFTP
jgi:hypothetical protein